MASIGHIKDLPAKDLGVDIQNNFEPHYEIIPRHQEAQQQENRADLKKTAKTADAIYLAADPDREGEAICPASGGRDRAHGTGRARLSRDVQ